MGSLGMAFIFIIILFFYSNAYHGKSLLSILCKFYYTLSLIGLTALVFVLVFNGPGKHQDILSSLSFFSLSYTFALYVYFYILSKCLIEHNWQIKHISLLVISSFVLFCSLYKNLILIWIIVTIICIVLTSKNRNKALKAFAKFSIIISALLVLSCFLFANDFSVLVTNLLKEFAALAQIDYSTISFMKTEVNEFTNEWGASRIFLWIQALPHIISNPIFGNGPGFENYLGTTGQLVTIFSDNIKNVATFHSQPISLLVEYGLVGFLSFYLLILNIASLGIKCLKIKTLTTSERHAILFFIALLATLFLSSLIGSYILPSHKYIAGTLVFWLILAAMVSEYKRIMIKYA